MVPHTSNPLYAAFVEQLSKDLCEGLTAVQTRKVSSALSVLGNTKQQEERDKASGKKKVGLSIVGFLASCCADDRLLGNQSWQLQRLSARQTTWSPTTMFSRTMTLCSRSVVASMRSCSPPPPPAVMIQIHCQGSQS
jgi:hypothetical protein